MYIYQLQSGLVIIRQVCTLAETRSTTMASKKRTKGTRDDESRPSKKSRQEKRFSANVLSVKTEGYIGWEEYFMAVAKLSAKRSKDPKTQVGACIVNKDKRIVGTGYNGMPDRCSDDELSWGKGKGFDNKKHYVCHAELNAILNKFSADLKDCTIFVTLFPCNQCAKMIIQSGIHKVVYLSDEKKGTTKVKLSERLLDMADVKYRPYRGKMDAIEIQFAPNTTYNVDPDQEQRPPSSTDDSDE